MKHEKESETAYASPERFFGGEYDYRLKKSEIRPAGDINSSYSADKIGMEGTVRRPFKWQDGYRISTGILWTGQKTDHINTWLLVPIEYYKGETFVYPGKPNAFTYEGMKVKWKGKEYILSKELVLMPRKEKTEEQLNLFV